jgi:hypothetical protein
MSDNKKFNKFEKVKGTFYLYIPGETTNFNFFLDRHLRVGVFLLATGPLVTKYTRESNIKVRVPLKPCQ